MELAFRTNELENFQYLRKLGERSFQDIEQQTLAVLMGACLSGMAKIAEAGFEDVIRRISFGFALDPAYSIMLRIEIVALIKEDEDFNAVSTLGFDLETCTFSSSVSEAIFKIAIGVVGEMRRVYQERLSLVPKMP